MDFIDLFTSRSKPLLVLPEKMSSTLIYATTEFIEAIDKLIGGTSMTRISHLRNENPPFIDLGETSHLLFLKQQDYLPNFPTDNEIGPEGMYIKWVSVAEQKTLVMYSPSPRGLLFGIYSFLHEFCGVRWFTSDSELFPKVERIQIPKNLEKIYRPGFPFRLITYIDCQDPEWAVRNRLNINFFAEDQHGGRLIDQGKMTHTFYQLLPPQIYYKDHPEYYALLPDSPNLNGPKRRQASGGGAWGTTGQLCLTNPDVLRLVVAKILEWRQEQLDVVGFGVAQNDTAAGYCQCDNCIAIDNKFGGNPSGSLIAFVSKVAEQVDQKAPGTKIFTLAYTYSEAPPIGIKAHPNVIVALCHMRPSCDAHPLMECEKNRHFVDNLQGWRKVTNNLVIWHYVVDFAHYFLPFPNLYALSKDVAWYHTQGVLGVLFQGNSSTSRGPEFQELKAWLLAQLSWDPHKDLWKLVGEFCRNYYSEGAPYLIEWLHFLNDQVMTNHSKCMDLYSGLEPEYLTLDVREKGWKLMLKALDSAKTNMKYYNRIEILLVSLLYTDLLIWVSDAPTSLKDPNISKEIIQEKYELYLNLCKRYNITHLAEGGGFESFKKKIEDKL